MSDSVASDVSSPVGLPLTYSVITQPTHGTLALNSDGSFTYTPSGNYVGTDSFVYQANDGHGGTVSDTYGLTVNGTQSTPANKPLTVSLENGAASLSFAVGNPSHGTLTLKDASTASYTYTPNANYVGSDSFTYTVDYGSGTVVATVAIQVNDVAPTAVSDTASTTVNTAVTKSIASDASSSVGLPLTFSKTSDPSHGTVTLNSSGTYTYTPTSNYVGTDSFTYQVDDGHGGTATATVALTVAEAANADSFTVITGAPIVVDPRTNDPIAGGYKNATISAINGTAITSGQTLTLSTGTTVTLRSDGRLAVKAASSGGASESFNYTFTDSNGAKTSAVTLTEYNDAAHAQALGFVFTVDTTKSGTSNSYSITLPVNTGTTATNAYTVFWGDGTSTSYTGSTAPSHTYATAGSHTITIMGEFAGLAFSSSGDCQKLTNISQWGDIALQKTDYAFYGCSNLTITATDIPDLSDCTSARYMFAGDTVNPNLSGVDVSHITDMTGMFYNNTAFNQDISGWNTSSATKMVNMFCGATAFNQSIGCWDTSHVTDMTSMFRDATAFNKDISGWNTSSVTTFYRMFSGASSFNQAIGGWDTSHVTDMSSMFGPHRPSTRTFRLGTRRASRT